MFRKELIYLNKKFISQEETINYLIKEIYNCELIDNKEVFKKEIMWREQQVSTAVGDKIAMPHGRSHVVKEPFVVFCRNSNDIKWGEEDVNTIFMIGVPDSDTDSTHLKTIAAISKKLVHDEFKEKLQSLKEENQIYELLRSI